MTWIATRPPTPDNPRVAEVMQAMAETYPSEYHPSRRHERRVPPIVMNDSIMLSHSLLPDVMRHTFAAFGAMMEPSLPLERRQHEMIATVVSVLNRCFY